MSDFFKLRQNYMQTYNKYYKSYSYNHASRPTPRRHLRNAAIVLGILSVLVIIKGLLALHPNKPKPSTPLAAAPSSQSTEEQAKKTVDMSALPAALQAITKQYPYNTSVAVIDLNSRQEIQIGDDAPYVAASTTKLITALLYLQNVEKGSTSLQKVIGDKTAKQHLQLMINKSDNDSWHTLNDYLGRENLEAYAREHGLDSYDATKNIVTSSDIARLLTELYHHELINKEHTELLYSWMQDTSEERFIPAGVPTTVNLYHKSGYLNDRVHDIAIIDNGSAPFVLVIYSKAYTGTYDYMLGQKLYQQLTAEVLQAFSR